MIRKLSEAYQTSDGRVFIDKSDAVEHEGKKDLENVLKSVFESIFPDDPNFHAMSMYLERETCYEEVKHYANVELVADLAYKAGVRVRSVEFDSSKWTGK